MARRTAALKPQLNQIRTWAREGRTDAWIAYQLGTTSLTVQEFRSEYGLDKAPRNPVEEPVTPELVVQTISFDSPPPLPPLADVPAPDDADAKTADERPRRQRRARPVKVDDEALEVEVIAESTADGEVAEAVAEADAEPERARRRRRRGGRGAGAAATADAEVDAPTAAAGDAKPSSRRKTRGAPAYTGSIVAGAVLVLDPAVTRSAAWRANWADAPDLEITLEDDQIVLRRRPSA